MSDDLPVKMTSAESKARINKAMSDALTKINDYKKEKAKAVKEKQVKLAKAAKEVAEAELTAAKEAAAEELARQLAAKEAEKATAVKAAEDTLTVTHAATIVDLKSAHTLELESKKNECTQEKEALISDHNVTIAKLNKEHSDAVIQLNVECSEKTNAALLEKGGKAAEAIKLEYEEKITNLNAEHKETTQALKSAHAAALLGLESQITDLQSTHEQELTTCTTDCAEAMNQLVEVCTAEESEVEQGADVGTDNAGDTNHLAAGATLPVANADNAGAVDSGASADVVGEAGSDVGEANAAGVASDSEAGVVGGNWLTNTFGTLVGAFRSSTPTANDSNVDGASGSASPTLLVSATTPSAPLAASGTGDGVSHDSGVAEGDGSVTKASLVVTSPAPVATPTVATKEQFQALFTTTNADGSIVLTEAVKAIPFHNNNGYPVNNGVYNIGELRTDGPYRLIATLDNAIILSSKLTAEESVEVNQITSLMTKLPASVSTCSEQYREIFEKTFISSHDQFRTWIACKKGTTKNAQTKTQECRQQSEQEQKDISAATNLAFLLNIDKFGENMCLYVDAMSDGLSLQAKVIFIKNDYTRVNSFESITVVDHSAHIDLIGSSAASTDSHNAL